MDLIGEATADRLAIGRAKDLRSNDRSIADARFKLKMADVTSVLSGRQLTLRGTRPKVASPEDKQRNLR